MSSPQSLFVPTSARRPLSRCGRPNTRNGEGCRVERRIQGFNYTKNTVPSSRCTSPNQPCGHVILFTIPFAYRIRCRGINQGKPGSILPGPARPRALPAGRGSGGERATGFVGDKTPGSLDWRPSGGRVFRRRWAPQGLPVGDSPRFYPFRSPTATARDTTNARCPYRGGVLGRDDLAWEGMDDAPARLGSRASHNRPGRQSCRLRRKLSVLAGSLFHEIAVPRPRRR